MLSLVGEGKGKKDEQSDGRKGGNQDPKMGMAGILSTDVRNTKWLTKSHKRKTTASDPDVKRS